MNVSLSQSAHPAAFGFELQGLFNERWLLSMLFDFYEAKYASLLREGRLLLARGNKDKEAFECFTRAAELGCPDAFGHLADLAYWRFGNNDGVLQAVKFALRGVELNDPLSMAMLSRSYCRGFGGHRKDQQRARQLLVQSWQLGGNDTTTRVQLSMSTLEFGLDDSNLVRILQLAVDLGDRSALILLGECFCFGSGVTEDNERGVALIRQAAELGDHYALESLGDWHYDGRRGLPRDEVKARQYYERAAALGNRGATSSLKSLYY